MRRLGSRYVLESVIGRGASGQVWRGHDTDGNPLAFKILRDSIADDRDSVTRFVQERHILTSLNDPHLVRVHDMVIEGETLALVMDLVEGGDLRAYMNSHGPLDPVEACKLTAQIADGLTAIHAAGILHRDIKPENVLLDFTSGTPVLKITDFSVARIVSTAKTSTMMAGTPTYIAPELFNDELPSGQSDLYSLGILLYELIAGAPPFRSDSLLTMMKLHATEPPVRPNGMPNAAWVLTSQLLAKLPTDRPHSAAAVGENLRAIGPETTLRRLQPIDETLRRVATERPVEPPWAASPSAAVCENNHPLARGESRCGRCGARIKMQWMKSSNDARSQGQHQPAVVPNPDGRSPAGTAVCDNDHPLPPGASRCEKCGARVKLRWTSTDRRRR